MLLPSLLALIPVTQIHHRCLSIDNAVRAATAFCCINKENRLMRCAIDVELNLRDETFLILG